MKKIVHFQKFIFFTLFIGLFVVAGLGDVATEFSELVILDSGRPKPLDTFARESLTRITKRASWKGPNGEKMDAMTFLIYFAFKGGDWQHEKIIRCDYLPLKAILDLDMGAKFFSWSELVSNEKVSELARKLFNTRDQTVNERKLASELSAIIEAINRLELVANPRSWKVIPPNSHAGRWLSVDEASGLRELDQVVKAWTDLGMAISKDEPDLMRSAIKQFKDSLLAARIDIYKQDWKFRLEVFYNKIHPFRISWVLSFLAFFIILVSSSDKTSKKYWLYWPGVTAFGFSVLMQVLGFTLRVLISGRAPVTNMYEVMVWTAFGAGLLALIFELVYRQKYLVLAAAAVATPAMILADFLPTVFDPGIQPLVAVLRSNYWLAIHVVTITMGYSGFLFSLGISHLALGYILFKPGESKIINNLTHFNNRILQTGVLFLAAGIVLGGLWAEKSWGRFWGWDPKETWSLIALLSYLAILHAKHIGWINVFGLNAGSVICFQTIVMAAYGVNYILGKGLHSYGFGVGGEIAVVIFIVLEIIFIIFASIKRKKLIPINLSKE